MKIRLSPIDTARGNATPRVFLRFSTEGKFMDLEEFGRRGRDAHASVNRILSDAEKAALAAENRRAQAAAAASAGAGVFGVDHLIDACGTDTQKLAGLAMLLATAAYGFGILAKKDANTLEQIHLYQRATQEIEKRITWEIAERPRCQLCGRPPGQGRDGDRITPACTCPGGGQWR